MRIIANIILILSCITIFILSGCDNAKQKNLQGEVQEANEIKVFCSKDTTFVVKDGEVFSTGVSDEYCNAGFTPQYTNAESNLQYNNSFTAVEKNIVKVGIKGLNCYQAGNNLYLRFKDGYERIIDDVSFWVDAIEPVHVVAYVKDSKLFLMGSIIDNLHETNYESEPKEINGLPDSEIVDIALWEGQVLVLHDNGEIRMVSYDNDNGYEIIDPYEKKEYPFTAKPVKFVRGCASQRIGIIDENDSLIIFGSYFDKIKKKNVIAENVRDAFCTLNSTYYLLKDGTLWGKGENSNGQLGTGDTNERKGFVMIMKGVKSFSGGFDFIVVVSEDDKVYRFGNNEVGQLSGTEKKYIVPIELNY